MKNFKVSDTVTSHGKSGIVYSRSDNSDKVGIKWKDSQIYESIEKEIIND